MKKNVTYIIILILGISCKQTNNKIAEKEAVQDEIILDSIYMSKNIDFDSNYKSLSLHVDGKPILKIGQSLFELKSIFSYKMDVNGTFQNNPLITDYMSTEDRISAFKIGKSSYINGTLYFSADTINKKIFDISGGWYIAEYDDNVEDSITNFINQNLFPQLDNKFKLIDGWNTKIESYNQTEYLSLEKNDYDSWSLEYKVKYK